MSGSRSHWSCPQFASQRFRSFVNAAVDEIFGENVCEFRGLPHDESPLDNVASQSASKRAYGHAAAVAPGHAKLPRTTTTRAREDSPEHAGSKDDKKVSWESSGDASWSRQGNSQRGVQETAAEKVR